jgi:hypothetical protein
MVSIAVSGCGIASVPELHHEIEDAAALIQKDLGARPRIGFGGWNGTVLKSVDVVFNSQSVSEIKVSELENKVRRILSETLKTPPESVTVSLRSGPLRLTSRLK